MLIHPGVEATVAPAPTASSAAPLPREEKPTQKEPKPGRPAAPTTKIDVVGGEPAGGVAEIEATQGDQVVFEVSSDEPEDVHVHGYDLAEDVGPGQKAAFDFAADLDGIYEVELENSATPIAERR